MPSKQLSKNPSRFCLAYEERMMAFLLNEFGFSLKEIPSYVPTRLAGISDYASRAKNYYTYFFDKHANSYIAGKETLQLLYKFSHDITSYRDIMKLTVEMLCEFKQLDNPSLFYSSFANSVSDYISRTTILGQALSINQLFAIALGTFVIARRTPEEDRAATSKIELNYRTRHVLQEDVFEVKSSDQIRNLVQQRYISPSFPSDVISYLRRSRGKVESMLHLKER